MHAVTCQFSGHVYSLANVKGSKRKGGKLSFDVLEDGIAIARATRGAGTKQYMDSLKFKFYTERSEVRFLTFCDSLSAAETCEAMLGAR